VICSDKYAKRDTWGSVYSIELTTALSHNGNLSAVFSTTSGNTGLQRNQSAIFIRYLYVL
jgi:hypothetical protein